MKSHGWRAWLANRLEALRASFWFVPSMMAAAALLLGLALPQLDEHLEAWIVTSVPWLATNADSARSTLASIAGMMISVAGVVFSITVVSLSIASSMFGSRLVRTFMTNRVTSFAMGSFVATGLFCLIVLRSIPSIDGPSVPHLSAAVGSLMAIACLGVLIWFVHNTALSIQAPHVIETVAHDLGDAVERLYPERIGHSPEDDDDVEVRFDVPDFEAGGDAIGSTRDGYVQSVDLDEILEIASREDGIIRIERRPGDFVCVDDPLVRIWPRGVANDNLAARVRELFIIGSRRTPQQDAEAAINELVEVAVRALSPGINDPFTAMTCVDHLGAVLGRLAERKMPSPYRFDGEKRLRVVSRTVGFPPLLDAAFHQIRQYGRRSVAVSIRMLEALAGIAARVQRPDDADAISRYADMIVEDCEHEYLNRRDREDLHERRARLRGVLGGKKG